MAGARALGHKPRTGFGASILEFRMNLALWLDLRLGFGLRQALLEKIGRAGLSMSPGMLALDMVLAALAGLACGIVLEAGVYAAALMLLGLVLPFLRVNDLGLRRQLSMRRDLPDALDLLTTCVEAGLGFDQALARVATRMRQGPLKNELEACVGMSSLGASRREGLRELERKAGLEELSQVVGALLQADKRGVPLGGALRAQSGQLRTLRSLRVKKSAAEAPLKMLFPLMVFILPVVFIVLFGPIILKWKSGGF
jgi:tight adherence protein C